MVKVQISLKARALRYLAAREHSRQELARKLARHAQEGDDIDAVLDQLEAAKLLSEARFTESLLNRRAARFGNSRILSELQSHGLPHEALQDAKARLVADEAVRAREARQKKFGRWPADSSERAKQIRFLQQRGFSSDSIRAALRHDEEAGD